MPLFALANAGVAISAELPAAAFTAPITLGILVGYVVGKPLGTAGAAWLVTKVTAGRIQPPVGWAAVLGAGTIAGIGFTVSLLIARWPSTARSWTRPSSASCPPRCAHPRSPGSCSGPPRGCPSGCAPALLGTAEQITDLAVPVDPERDHVRGPMKSPVTVVEYGDFECPYCGQAEPVVRELLADYGDVRYVWRHLPLTDVHPHAQLAAEGAEAADRPGRVLGDARHAAGAPGRAAPRATCSGYAAELGLDVAKFTDDLRNHVGAAHVAEDVDSADLSGVSGTPTFFVNDRRHYGAYDIDALTEAVRSARARAFITA